MKFPLRACLLLLMASAATCQEPSCNDLRTLLHADVKSYANDGHLVASWSLKKGDELKAFTNQDPARIRLVEGEGLAMASDPSGRALLLFRELELEQPCTISFEVRPDDANSS